jgi:hypothetical protein
LSLPGLLSRQSIEQLLGNRSGGTMDPQDKPDDDKVLSAGATLIPHREKTVTGLDRAPVMSAEPSENPDMRFRRQVTV